jgi:glycogen debranching enzyme
MSEQIRLKETTEKNVPWKKWGPYLSERQWGTVREDYSDNGSAWDYFSHDQARSRVYRWGEDGLAGISDDQQRICFALALWNSQDPILKERLFGLTNSEGNHGEDVKEYYFYLDNTPTHSYMKYLYKYPQSAYPYNDLINTNRASTRNDFEYELIDTGVFNGNEYFDVFVEYAKETSEDILIKISVNNRGSGTATLHVLPSLWFRNIWSDEPEPKKPQLKEAQNQANTSIIVANDPTLGEYRLYCDGDVPLLFTENETNNMRLFGSQNQTQYVKDGINNYVVNNQVNAVNPEKIGTKASAHYHIVVGPGDEKTIKLRLTNQLIEPSKAKAFFDANFDRQFKLRRQEADAFYETIQPSTLNDDQRRVLRQALSGMLWSKQYYTYDVAKWLGQHKVDFYNKKIGNVRNSQWFHMANNDVISMPDKWEYPWYAAWDLAFHAVALSLVDQSFAKQQLELMLEERYLHPSGQVPAYEWNFNDVNPPVHAWAVLFNYRMEQQLLGKGDIDFLEDAFQKLLLNFTWWVNRKDRNGSNVFEGGFLGLDNIGVFDRSATLPNGAYLEQADGTAWMAMYCQNMLEMAVELAREKPIYEELAIKFYEHFLWIAHALQTSGLWDEEDGFFYDVLQLPDNTSVKLKTRSMVGLISLCANSVFPGDTLEKLPKFAERAAWFSQHHPELLEKIHRPGKQGVLGRFLVSLLDDEKLSRILSRTLDENEFLSPYGIRSLSKYYADHPYSMNVKGRTFGINYQPAESTTGDFGGNSNWRGPVWFPINALIIRGLLNLYSYYGKDFLVEYPSGSGKKLNLFEISKDIANRLSSIFLRNKEGMRPVFGGAEKFQKDPNWKDNILFYEYFHGDNGAGLGASHQTGWTGLVAVLLKLYGSLTGEEILQTESGGMQAFAAAKKPQAIMPKDLEKPTIPA